MSKSILTKSREFISLVRMSETRKSQFIYKWLKIWKTQQKIEQICVFINTPCHIKVLCKKRLKISILFKV